MAIDLLIQVAHHVLLDLPLLEQEIMLNNKD
jgi:hypothetical protein